MPVVVPVSEVFSFSIYHLLPLADPVAPFPTEVVRFPAPQRFPRSRRTGMRLSEAADVIRSKNGPSTVTVDLFFGDEPKYAVARSLSLLTVERVAAAYAVRVDQVKGVWWTTGSKRPRSRSSGGRRAATRSAPTSSAPTCTPPWTRSS